MIGVPAIPAPGLELVAARAVIEPSIEARFALRPGDRALVAVGEPVVPGSAIAERVRDTHLEEVLDPGPDPRPGGRWSGELPVGSLGLRRRSSAATGELLFASGGRWRLATGELAEPLEVPAAGVVREVRAGMAIVIRLDGRALRGIAALGGPARGMLQLATGAAGEIRPGGVDVGSAGRILVVGSRVDAETLTRARAMGVRGMIVSGLSGKERRDFVASEARQRSSLHRLPPFAVLVLDGAARRSIATPVMAVLEALAGREVGIVADPPCLVVDDPAVELPAPDPSWIRVRSGPLAGQEGRWDGLAGMRRFAAGTHLEAGYLRIGDEPPLALPLADLERFA